MARGAIAFDVIGTLFSLGVVRDTFAELGAPPRTFDVWFAGALRDYFARSHSGAYTPLRDVLEDTLERAARIVEWETDHATAGPKVMGSFRQLAPVPGAARALEDLHRAGWHNVAVTNSGRGLIDDLLGDSGLGDHMSTVISCDDLGVSKPHPRVYEEVKKLSRGNEVWLVAAHAWDVAGALAAGMRAVWIATNEHVYPEVFPSPDRRAEDVASAARFILDTSP